MTNKNSGPESNDNEGVLHILKSSQTGALWADGLVSYLEDKLEESYSSVEIQPAYSTVPANWAHNMVVVVGVCGGVHTIHKMEENWSV